MIAFSGNKTQNESSNEKKGISIVIAAHYEYENLKKHLPKLLDQDYQRLEIVVVDDRSHDETYNYLISLRDKHPNFKLVRVDEVPHHANAKKYALTLGIKAASHPVVLLTDADCYPASKKWVNHMANSYTDETDIVLGYSQYEKRKGLLNYLIRYETLFTGIQYLSAALFHSPYMGVGRNLSYKKELFIEKKGFGQLLKTLGGDDDLFVNRHSKKRNTTPCISPETLVYSLPKTTTNDYVHQKRRHLSVGKKYKLSHRIKLGWRMMHWLMFYLSFITACAFVFEPYIILGSFTLRNAIWLLAVYLAKKKLGDPIRILPVVIVDFIYIIFYFFTGITLTLDKRIKWT